MRLSYISDSEVNLRFGGEYPHAHECGCDHMTLIPNNLEGRINRSWIGAYEDEVHMMKYYEVSIIRKTNEAKEEWEYKQSQALCVNQRKN